MLFARCSLGARCLTWKTCRLQVFVGHLASSVLPAGVCEEGS